MMFWEGFFRGYESGLLMGAICCYIGLLPHIRRLKRQRGSNV